MSYARLMKIWLLAAISLAAAGFSLLYGEYSVSDVVYSPYGPTSPTVSSVMVSPAAACIGDSVTLSGTGLLYNTYGFEAKMYPQAGGFPISFLGNSPDNNVGIWSLTTTIPVTGTDEKNQPENIIPGLYTISVRTSGLWEVPGYNGEGTLEVLECSNSGTGSMPSTGFPVTALALLSGAVLLTFMGVAFGIRKLLA